MSDPSTQPIMDQLYATITGLFGVSDNQQFVLETPGRVLDEASYAYDADSIYSIVEKPQPVIEAEFRLSDDLYDASNLAAGPNGKKLSLQYLSALNNLVPAVGSMQDFDGDRERLRGWLLEEIEATIQHLELDLGDGKKPITPTISKEKFKGSRMALFQEMMQNYVSVKAQWDSAKTERLETAKGSGSEEAMDDFTRWLANIAPAVETQLEALFADLVVRGYYHEVKTFLGFLDVASPAEALEDAKTRMRDSSMSALDESETIYPVVMEPSDWFRALSTDYTPVDLALDPLFLGQSVVALENQLDQLTAQRQQASDNSPGDLKTLQAQVASAQQTFDDAQSAQVSQFGSAAVATFQAAVKIYQSTSGLSAADAAGVLGKLESGDQTTSTAVAAECQKVDPLETVSTQLADLAKAQDATIKAQQALMTASRALSDLQAKTAGSEANQSLLDSLDAQIASVRGQIDTLKTILLADGQPGTGLPSTQPQAGRWYDVILQIADNSKSSTSSLQQSASNSSWDVDFLFGSASGGSGTAQGSAAAWMQQNAKNVKVSFRATKVTFDRGGWFDPGLLDQTKGMYRLNADAVVSAGAAAEKGKSATSSSILPSYPVAFVVAKDINLDITTNAAVTDDVSNYLHQTSSAGGGFLCFSASSSSSSTQKGQAFYSKADQQALTIRIPGPQILGWVLEFVQADSAGQYTKLPSDYLDSITPTQPKPPVTTGGFVAADASATGASASGSAATPAGAASGNGRQLVGGQGG